MALGDATFPLPSAAPQITDAPLATLSLPNHYLSRRPPFLCRGRRWGSRGVSRGRCWSGVRGASGGGSCASSQRDEGPTAVLPPAAPSPPQTGDIAPHCLPLSFPRALQAQGLDPTLRRREISTVQVNVGLYCNQACSHCHVDSSPQRTEMMDRPTAQRIVDLLASSPGVQTVDLTGGAPELNPQFRFLVQECRKLGKAVIDRCNLTVLLEPGQEDLGNFLKRHQVKVVASLPCYSASNVDKQRGRSVFERSIDALQRLNALGYGIEGTGLGLDLVYNPNGPFLPPPQAGLEQAYKSELWDCYGIKFNHLLTVANMPINRFRLQLEAKGLLDDYMGLLASSFNADTVTSLMCSNLASIRWDGALFDCDFNQQLVLDMPASDQGKQLTVFNLTSFDSLVNAPIAVGPHCFGCTAGQGSSCGGALASS